MSQYQHLGPDPAEFEVTPGDKHEYVLGTAHSRELMETFEWFLFSRCLLPFVAGFHT